MMKPLALRIPQPRPSSSGRLWLPALALLLVAATPGCYHATGIQRSTPVAEEIPSTGGDRVVGLKSAAGPGDYFLGNDAVALAVDGLPYGAAGVPIAGALSGGSIVDAGFIELDNSYKRTSMPTDLVERLTPVVNQDPLQQMIFDTFTVTNTDSGSSLVMTGRVTDSSGSIVAGAAVTHRISLGSTDRFFLLETTVTNTGLVDLPIHSIGDFLLQKGGGFRFNIPAYQDNSENALTTWGVEIPGTSFDTTHSVRTRMVGLMGVEPSSATVDAHTSLGFLPVDEEYLLVACDPQPVLVPAVPATTSTLTETRPLFPSRLVVGKPQAASSLAASKSLTYRRRLYAVGGSTQGGATGTRAYAYSYPNQATGIFNLMTKDRVALRSPATGGGWVAFQAMGSAARYGGAPTEIRIEKEDGTLERVEWLEPQENLPTTGSFNPFIWAFLPVGTYRITVHNLQPSQWGAAPSYLLAPFSYTLDSFINANDTDRPNLATQLVVEKVTGDTGNGLGDGKTDFVVSGTQICPEHDFVTTSGSGSLVESAYLNVAFYSQERNGPTGHLQPIRLTFQGTTVPDPELRRTRSLGGAYDTSTKAKGIGAANFGCYGFGEGNQAFGTAFKYGAPFNAALIKGDYTVYATRGPLSILETRDISVTTSSTNAYTFLVFPTTRPSGWTTFDMPGPSQATSGGLLPCEKLSGALAEGIQVVANTEEDQLTDSTTLRDEFRKEIEDPLNTTRVTDAQRTAVGSDPFVVPARTSDLFSTGFGVVTALFTPTPTTARSRGARLPDHWTLADFIKQAEGSYQVVNRPRGPRGLFTLQSPSQVVTMDDAWLSGSGTYAGSKTNGDFDAIELISAQAFWDLGPTDWFAEFQRVRADWFSLLSKQTPAKFTKALGLSSARFTKDTPVGLARTYLQTTAYSTTNTSGFTQDNLSPIQTALKSGAAVASTGPFLNATIAGSGPGSLVTAGGSPVTVTVTVVTADWAPVDEVRIIVNGGAQVITQAFGTAHVGWTQDATDTRKWTRTFSVNLASDSWIVAEAGVPLTTTGAYAAGTPWARIMHGIYPVAVTNPIFVDLTGDGYRAPGID